MDLDLLSTVIPDHLLAKGARFMDRTNRFLSPQNRHLYNLGKMAYIEGRGLWTDGLSHNLYFRRGFEHEAYDLQTLLRTR